LIDKSGYIFILPEVILLVITYLFYFPLFIFILILTIFTIFFFRDPPREIHNGIISPADGKIDYVDARRLEIFMSPLDCHITRAPVSGKITKIIYKKGTFFPAYRRGEQNERNEIYISNEGGEFKVTQIAGFFARRIVCYVREGEEVKKGQKIGIIRFGSRITVDFPEGYRITRKPGEKIKAGETIAIR